MIANDGPAEKPYRADWRVLAGLAILLLAAAWLFFDVLEDYVIDHPLVSIDTVVFSTFQHMRTPALDRWVITVTEFGDTLVTLAVTAALAAWLLWKRAWRTAIYWIVAVAGGSAINTAIKGALHRARPLALYQSGWTSYSFPSGHSTVNAVIYGFLAVIVVRQAEPRWRSWVIAGAALLVGIIATSRLYLGAHWFSDVVGGLAFGTLWIALLAGFYLFRQADRFSSRQLLLVAVIALAVSAGVNIALHRHADDARYAVKPPALHLPNPAGATPPKIALPKKP
ncbi:MAG: phosphatase PAP2 family protein [Asticcacaulis sp.]